MSQKSVLIVIMVAGILILALMQDSLPVIGDVSLPPAATLATVHFLDVGQGDAILIVTRESTALIDGGDVWASNRILSYLESVALDGIDHVILSHPHSDHVGGLVEILRSVTVGSVHDPGFQHPTGTYQQFLETVLDLDIPYHVARARTVIELASGVTLEILAPFEEFIDNTSSDANNNSVIARMVAGETAFLFTGDAQHAAEGRLLRMGAPLRADVLKVAHHGSRSSSSSLFIDQVRPRVAVISVGAYNEYGHPHQEVLDRLESVCEDVWRTDRHGTIVITTDGRTIAVYPERPQGR